MIETILHTFDMQSSDASLLHEKDGVAVYRIVSAGTSYILKAFQNQADRREITNYKILHTLGIQTLKIIHSTDSALLMEDVAQSQTLRLGLKGDMDNPAIAAQLARWYLKLHTQGKAYVCRHGKDMYDETDVITPENMRMIAAKTGTESNEAWALLHKHFPVKEHHSPGGHRRSLRR